MRSKFLKNLQWKKKLKRLGALGLCALLIAGNLTIPDVAKAASTSVTYPALEGGESAIENSLTYFQYMTSGDCTIGQHTVGAIAVGGTFTQTANTFGDGAQTASYANRIAFAKAPNLASGFQGVCNDVYYVTTDMSGDQLAGFTYNANYMDIPGIFNNIRTESSTLADSGIKIPAESVVDYAGGTITGKAIVVDFTVDNGTNGYTIPYEVLANADFIDIKLNNISDLVNKKCVINITGMDSVTDMFEMYGSSNAGGVSNNSLKVGVLFNGEAKSAIKDMASQDVNTLGGQVFLNGMKLIFNLPDYTGTLRTECFEGHVVAPNAKVIPGGGNMQGGVVAKEVFVAESDNNDQSAQAHYYPYNAPTAHYGCTPANASGDVCDSIILNKVYQAGDVSNSIPMAEWPALGQGAKFTLYKWENGARGAVVVENVEAKLYGDVHQVHISGEYLERGEKYVLEETSAAQGYVKSDMLYYCTVDDNGDIYYSTDSNNPGTREIQTCVNYKSTTPKGLIEVTVQEEGSTEKIPDIAVTIKKDGNEYTLHTEEDGKVVFTNVDAGEYEVSIPAENTGYEPITDDSYKTTVTVVENQTAVHTFTLTEITHQPTTGSIMVTVKENSAEGQGMNDVCVTVTSKTDASVKYTASTANGGTITFDNLPFGDYTVSTTGKLGYTVKDSATADVSVTEEQNGTHEFILQPQPANITVNVTCGGNGVNGVTVEVTKGEDSPVSYQTATGGKVSLPGVEPDTYKVQITAPTGYTIVGNDTQSVNVPAGGNVSFDFALKEEVQTPITGTINVVVKDNDNAPVSGVTVQVKNSQNVEVNLNAPATDANGVTGKDDLAPDTYTVVITPPDGYVCEGPTEQTDFVNAGSVVDYEFTLAKCEDLKVIVIDTTTGEEVTGESTVMVSSGNNEVDSSTFTGNKTFIDVKEGEYTVELTSYPNGYAVQGEDSKPVTIDADDNITESEVIFELVPTGKITVTVKDDSDVAMNDVTVTLKSGDTVIASSDTVNGEVVFDSLGDKTYTVEIEDVDGYEIKSKTPDSDIVISDGSEKTCAFVLAQTQPETAGIKVVVKDEKGNLVKDVTVEIEEKTGQVDSVVFTGGTNENGEAEKTGLNPSYAHSITITAPEGYTYENDRQSEPDVTLTAGQTTTCEFTLVKTAKIKINVIDTSTREKYTGTVTFDIDKKVGEGWEDFNDSYSVSGGYDDGLALAEGRYQINLNETSLPEGYAVVYGYDEITFEPYTQEEYELTFRVAPSGTINVTVTEDDNPVVGKNVELYVKDKDTNIVDSFVGTTESDGTVVFEDVPAGEYEIRVQVTEGNTTEIKTKKGTFSGTGTKDETIELSEQEPGTGKISYTVKDDQNKYVGGVRVTVKKVDSDSFDTYISSGEGTVVISGLEPGDYTVAIEKADMADYVCVDSEITDTVREGDTTNYEFVLSKRCTLKVVVLDKKTGLPIKSPKISVSNGEDVSKEIQNATEFTLTELKAGDYEATVVAPDGYVLDGDATQRVSLDPYAEDTYNEPYTLIFYLTPVGKLEIHVKDDNPAGSSYVDGVPVTVEDEKGNSVSIGSQTTAGVITLDDLTPGEYTVTIGDKNGYIVKNNQKTITKTVNAGDTATVYDFTLAKYATLEIDIYDITTGTPIHLDGDGDVIAKIEILRDSQSFNTKSLTYGNSEYVGVLNGQYQTTLTDLPEGYQVVSEDGETVVTDIDPYDPNGPADGTYKVVFNVIKCGTVTVDVKENNENGDPVEDVKVTLYLDKGNHNYEIFGSEQTTGTDGTVTFTDVPVRDYKVVISKENDGYEDLTDTECTKEGSFDQNLTAEESFYLTPEQATPTTGSLRVTVVEKGTTNNVPGVTVTITNTEDDSTMQRYITTNDTNGGVLLFNNIPTGTYIVEATPSVTGYKTLTGAQSKCEVEVKVTPQATHTFEYEPEQAAATGLLEVTVVEKGTTTGIDGVTVTVVDSKGGTHTADTNGNGHASFNNLPIGSCVITIPAKVDGYETLAENANKDTTVVIEGNVEKTSKFELEKEKTADLIITVTDEKTNDPVPGAKVKITKPAPANGTTSQGESEIKETGNDGRIVMKGLPKGKYTTTVVSVPEGYNVTTNKEITVELDPETAPEAQVDYKVGQVGALKVTITEKGTTNGIYGVQVAITTNASGTEKTVYTYTDANGQVNLAGQEVGTYKISIPTSIAGYKELDAAYVVQTKDVEVNKTTEYAFEVEKVTTADPNKGDAEITVTDEVTGKPVPGASVIVTAPDNTTRKYTTDGNGVISMPQQNPGEYKVEVIEVPAGYTVTQNQQTTIMVVAGSTVKTEIKVKPTDSAGDSNEGVSGGTGEAQPDNGGTTDNNGGTVNTGGTSNSTGDVVNTGGATDSNTGGVITTGQTDGATNNKTTDSQSVSKQPKTGDETNPGIIWIILSVSACLAAASVIGLVYVKKKED